MTMTQPNPNPDQTQFDDRARHAKLRLISDNELYAEANQFAAEPNIPDTKQLYSLLNYAVDWNTLNRFVKHQKERTWELSKAYYVDFYTKLDGVLNGKNGLMDRTKTRWGLVPPGLNKTDTNAVAERWAAVAAHEFIQHFVAEALSRSVSGN